MSPIETIPTSLPPSSTVRWRIRLYVMTFIPVLNRDLRRNGSKIGGHDVADLGLPRRSSLKNYLASIIRSDTIPIKFPSEIASTARCPSPPSALLHRKLWRRVPRTKFPGPSGPRWNQRFVHVFLPVTVLRLHPVSTANPGPPWR